MQRRAMIVGVTGQDGAYLAQLLLKKGYEVYGTYRRNASNNTWRLTELGIEQDIKLLPMDVFEITSIIQTLQKVKPDEVYNLAAQSFVGYSFDLPIYTADVDAMGVIRILEAIKTVVPKCRFYQASTSEMFGKVKQIPQTEETPFHPRSPYGVAKLFGHWITVNYREAHGMYCTSGILFNHESPLRGQEFVTRKITSTLALIREGRKEVLELGNLEALRDWGFAGDYVRGMWLMLQKPEPNDYVLATGETHSVRNFVTCAAEIAGFHLKWEGEGLKTRGIDAKTSKTIVRMNPDYYRPAEVDLLKGDATKANNGLDWKPEVNFSQLVELMMKADLDRASRGLLL